MVLSRYVSSQWRDEQTNFFSSSTSPTTPSWCYRQMEDTPHSFAFHTKQLSYLRRQATCLGDTSGRERLLRDPYSSYCTARQTRQMGTRRLHKATTFARRSTLYTQSSRSGCEKEASVA